MKDTEEMWKEVEPLTKFECEQWRQLLDVLMHDANL
ncbi:hypothetical protein LCGC14_2895040, partial [marine sediment metagenome]